MWGVVTIGFITWFPLVIQWKCMNMNENVLSLSFQMSAAPLFCQPWFFGTWWPWPTRLKSAKCGVSKPWIPCTKCASPRSDSKAGAKPLLELPSCYQLASCLSSSSKYINQVESSEILWASRTFAPQSSARFSEQLSRITHPSIPGPLSWKIEDGNLASFGLFLRTEE